MVRVLVFGTFDLLHEGHKHFFKQAKKHGDELCVVIARDTSVQKIKGFKPHQTETERQNNVQELKTVTKAVLGNEDDYYKIIEQLQPDIICLGYDQHPMNVEQELKKRNLNPKILTLESHEPHIYKSSLMKKRNNHERT
jgi:FAD synthetase